MAQEQKYVIEIMGYVHEQNFKLDSKVLFKVCFEICHTKFRMQANCMLQLQFFFFAKIGFLHLFFVE